MATTADRDLTKLNPEFKKKVDSFLNEVKQTYGNIIFVTEGWRSQERQIELYKAGKSQRNGTTNKSEHQKGLAIDIAFNGATLYPNDINTWNKVATIGKKWGMVWGGDWKSFPDKPHFEDNGKPYVDPNPKQVSPWAKEAVELAKQKGIATQWDNPQEVIANATMESMLFKLGGLSKEEGNLTKERAVVALHNLGLF